MAQAVQTREQNTDEHRERVASALVALGNRDGQAFGNAFDAYRARAWETLGAEQYAELRARFVALAGQMPLTDNERLELARALCLDRLVRQEQT